METLAMDPGLARKAQVSLQRLSTNWEGGGGAHTAAAAPHPPLGQQERWVFGCFPPSLLAALLPPQAPVCAGGQRWESCSHPLGNIHGWTLQIALGSRPINFLVTSTSTPSPLSWNSRGINPRMTKGRESWNLIFPYLPSNSESAWATWLARRWPTGWEETIPGGGFHAGAGDGSKGLGPFWRDGHLSVWAASV